MTDYFKVPCRMSKNQKYIEWAA
jgi:hypothetical protein